MTSQFNMTAMTSFRTEKCCHLVIAHARLPGACDVSAGCPPAILSTVRNFVGSGTGAKSLLIFFLLLFFLERPRLRRFKSNRDEIWQDTHRLTESILISRQHRSRRRHDVISPPPAASCCICSSICRLLASPPSACYVSS